MRRFLVAACFVAFVAAGVAQAGAYFTDQASVPDNIITAGNVEVSVEPTSGALSIPSLAPGQTARRSLEIANTGSLDCDVVVTGAKRAGYTSLYEALTCRVVHGATVLYEGPLATLRTTPLRIDSSAAAGVSFDIALPADAGNDLMGDYVKLTLYVDAEQLRS
jgi:predicted ribosomally synthesized peptide with SipW-like signal peptide